MKSMKKEKIKKSDELTMPALSNQKQKNVLEDHEKEIIDHLRNGNSVVVEIDKCKIAGKWNDCYLFTPLTFNEVQLKANENISDTEAFYTVMNLVASHFKIKLDTFSYATTLLDHIWNSQDKNAFMAKRNVWLSAATIQAISSGASLISIGDSFILKK